MRTNTTWTATVKSKSAAATPSISLISSLVDSGETRPGVVWFVHHDLHPMTGQGIRTAIPCRVFLARFEAP